MRQKQPSSSKRSLRTLIFFCIIVVFLLFLSLIFRLVYFIQTSQFTGDNRFTIAFVSDGKNLDIVSYSPDGESLSHVDIKGSNDINTAKMAIGVFTDTTINLDNEFSLDKRFSSYMIDSLLHKKAKSTLSSYDLLRLAIATWGITKDEISSEQISLPMDRIQIDQITKDLFYDKALSQENMTIAIVNGTVTEGLGGRLERALITMGANIISVKNADTRQAESSIVYFGEKNYTVSRLEKLLAMPAKSQVGRGLSDIIIIIGQDKKDTLSY